MEHLRRTAWGRFGGLLLAAVLVQQLVRPAAAAAAAATTATFADAVAIHQSGDLDRAWSAYEAVLAQQPTGESDTAALVLHNMGTIMHARGELQTAAELIERAIYLHPADATYRNTLGVVQRSGGDLAGAVASFEAVVAAAPEMHAAHLNLANTLHFYLADNPEVGE